MRSYLLCREKHGTIFPRVHKVESDWENTECPEHATALGSCTELQMPLIRQTILLST